MRYNAEKSCIGSYFSTKIYQFRMRCHLCPNYIIIKTDPEKRDYTIVSGAKRKVETYSAEDAGVIAFDVKEEDSSGNDPSIPADPLLNLEKKQIDVEKARKDIPHLRELMALSAETSLDDFQSNRLLRKRFRTEKKEAKEELEDRFHKNIIFPLVSETEEEREVSRSEFHAKSFLSQIQRESSTPSSSSSSSSSSILPPSSVSSSTSSKIKVSSLSKAGSIFDGTSCYGIDGKKKNLHDMRLSAIKKRRRAASTGGLLSQVATTTAVPSPAKRPKISSQIEIIKKKKLIDT